jgi:MSHA pilin protein MshC
MRFPGRNPGAARRDAGYTIVELVIVMVLLGILAANALPRFFTASRFEVMGFADASAAALRHAQKLARSSGCDTLFRIDAGGYGLFQRATSCHDGALTRAVNRTGGVTWQAASPSGVVITSLSVFFDADGRPLDAATSNPLAAVTQFTVGDRTIAIQPETGFVQVQ